MSAKILVIEDNDLNRKLFNAILESGHYDHISAADAEEGLKLAKEHHPDLILMDIQLPGMDGLTATRHLKEDPVLKNIPVIALTAYAMPEDKEKALSAGCDGYISKPVDVQTLLERVSFYLEKAGKETG